MRYHARMAPRLPPLRDPNRSARIDNTYSGNGEKLPPLRGAFRKKAEAALLRHHYVKKLAPKAEVRFYPPAASKRIAAEALAVRASLPKSKRGGLTTQEAGAMGVGSGVARARDIIAGKSLDARQVKRFFDRFGRRISEAKKAGHTMATSKVLQDDGLWGGEPAKKAAIAALREAGE